MKTQQRALIGACAALCPLAVAGHADAASLTQTFSLDAYEKQGAGDRYAGPVSSDPILVPGVPRLVVVEGAVSLWAKRNWSSSRFQVCGRPLSRPPFPSPDVADGEVGVDADSRFALVRKPAGACPDLPDRGPRNFEINTGDGYYAPKPLLGIGHAYTYLIAPSSRRIRVRLYDPVAKDNYGRFRITILPSL